MNIKNFDNTNKYTLSREESGGNLSVKRREPVYLESNDARLSLNGLLKRKSQ